MVSIVTLVATLVISLLVTRIGSVALTLTGMSRDSARFQARSCYTGVGFTTSESEQVVNHPVRRRILMALMLLGNIGIAVVIASMMSTFAQGSEQEENDWSYRLGVLSVSLLLLWIIVTQKFVDQALEKLIAWSLKKWTTLDVRDYQSLLHLADGYVVFEITVNPDDWVAEKSLAESTLSAEGVLVLGIHRTNGKYVGSPSGQTIVQRGDVLTVYGPAGRLEELDIRKVGYEGDKAHEEAMKVQEKAVKIAEIEESDLGDQAEKLSNPSSTGSEN